jgi:hypothetical protein
MMVLIMLMTSFPTRQLPWQQLLVLFNPLFAMPVILQMMIRVVIVDGRRPLGFPTAQRLGHTTLIITYQQGLYM